MYIRNQGQAVVETDYWDSTLAEHGLCYLTWSAGAARLLVPESMQHILPTISAADSVIISQGPWHEAGVDNALEVLWEDGTDSPLALYIQDEACDRILTAGDAGREFPFSVWTREGKHQSWTAYLRQVSSLPHLQPLDW